jgi:hypothetical protein
MLKLKVSLVKQFGSKIVCFHNFFVVKPHKECSLPGPHIPLPNVEVKNLPTTSHHYTVQEHNSVARFLLLEQTFFIFNYQDIYLNTPCLSVWLLFLVNQFWWKEITLRLQLRGNLMGMVADMNFK